MAGEPAHPLATVHERLRADILAPIDQVLEHRIAWLQRRPQPAAAVSVRFFEWLAGRVDPAAWRQVQDEFLAPDRFDFPYLKFLHPTHWFEDKLRVAALLGLPGAGPARVLDLGTGAGHFLLVAEFFGHHATGSEAMRRDPDPDDDLTIAQERASQRLFAALGQVFRLNRVEHAVTPFGDLSVLPADNRWITAFLAAFDRPKSWTLAAWQDFLVRLADKFDADDGGLLYMTLIHRRLDPDDWSFLERLSRPTEFGSPLIDAGTLRSLRSARIPRP